MTQPFPEPRPFDPRGGSDAENPQNLLEGRRGIVALVASSEAHESGWAAEAAVALAQSAHRAGHTAGLMDMAIETPRLHAAAGVATGEGLTDVVLFGASVERVSRLTSSGVRVITAGTPVGVTEEIWGKTEGSSEDSDAKWVRAARTMANDGCVLAYAVAASEGADALLKLAEDVILVRHEGDQVAPLSADPSLVLEPWVDPPEPTTAEAVIEEHAVADAAVEDPRVPPNTSGVEEVTLDLDDVVGDLAVDAEPVFVPGPSADSPNLQPPSSEPDPDVSGLEVGPEWPAFEEPIEVHDPGSVDPLVAAASEATAELEDSGLDDIVGQDSELTIVSDDLEVSDQSRPFGERLDTATNDSIGPLEGLIDGGQDTLSRVGEDAVPSADLVSGLDSLSDGDLKLEEPGLVDPSGWGPPPTADVPDVEAATSSEDFKREDPWGEPLDEAPTPIEEVTPVLESAEPLAPSAAPVEAEGEVLPWQDRLEEKQEIADADVPVAEVTRTRTRTRRTGPRPFLLVLFLLLVVTVGVLWWVEVLDVPILDGLRGDEF